jgi:uncharacterized protein YndB with AHSA1/START domain
MRWFLVFLMAGSAWGQLSFVNEGIVDAPPSEVWKVWSTAEGFKILGVSQAEVELRVGGAIRSRYKSDGPLGDAETIVNRIMAFEPQRMLAIRIERPPKSFPFKEAWKSTWTVLTLTDLNGRTHVRAASLGYGDDEESRAMRRFFEQGNQYEIELIQKHFAKK